MASSFPIRLAPPQRREAGAVPRESAHPVRPGAIIRRLDPRRPIYLATAAGGHFGRAGLPWEEDTFGDRLPPVP